MKKLLTLLTALALAGFFWWGSRAMPAKTSAREKVLALETPSRVLQQDYQNIVQHLAPQDVAGEEWKKINNYHLDPQEIVTKENAKDFFRVAKEALAPMYACLKKDFCGMEPSGEDDAYFDQYRTPAHILLNRNLQVLRESLKKDASLKREVDWDLLGELSRDDSEMLEVEALAIIREFHGENVETAELIKSTAHYKGTAKARALMEISQQKGAKENSLLAREIEDVFSMADAHTAISVLENLEKMSLSALEIERVLGKLCRFKTEGENAEGNWKMIKYQAKKFLSLDHICS